MPLAVLLIAALACLQGKTNDIYLLSPRLSPQMSRDLPSRTVPFELHNKCRHGLSPECVQKLAAGGIVLIVLTPAASYGEPARNERPEHVLGSYFSPENRQEMFIARPAVSCGIETVVISRRVEKRCAGPASLLSETGGLLYITAVRRLASRGHFAVLNITFRRLVRLYPVGDAVMPVRNCPVLANVTARHR